MYLPNVDPVLSGLSVAYMQDSFIADIVAPRIPVDLESGEYPVYDKSSFRAKTAPKRKGMAEAQDVYMAASSDTYKCEWESRRHPISQDDIEKAKKLGMDPVADGAEILGEIMKVLRENRVAAVYNGVSSTYKQTLATYNSSTNPTYVFLDDYTNSHPFQIIGKAKKRMHKAIGRFPTHIWFNPDIEEIIACHPDRNTFKSQTQDVIITNELPGQLMGMTRLAANAIYDAANRDKTADMTYAWGNNIYLAYITPSKGLKKPTSVYTFDLWGGLLTEQYEPSKEKKGIYVECNEKVDEKIVCSDCIFILTNVLENPIS